MAYNDRNVKHFSVHYSFSVLFISHVPFIFVTCFTVTTRVIAKPFSFVCVLDVVYRITSSALKQNTSGNKCWKSKKSEGFAIAHYFETVLRRANSCLDLCFSSKGKSISMTKDI